MVSQSVAKREKEFRFTDKDFETVRKSLYTKTGIALNDGKRDLVYGRLSRRLRLLGFAEFTEYLAYIESAEGQDELSQFINALTTNLTAFFREPHHFDYLAKTILPEAMRRHNADRRIRIWSAGCSTGEEPYSIAIVVNEVMLQQKNWDLKILATDLDSNVVEKAKSGKYALERIAGLSSARTKKWFHKCSGLESDKVQVNTALQELITFKQLNLMQHWPMKGYFDLIFCRNVVIYFDKPTQKKLFERYANLLVNGGYLFIGHSETMHNLSDRFRLIGQTMYQKIR